MSCLLVMVMLHYCDVQEFTEMVINILGPFILLFFPAGGVIASILVVLCLFWIGLVDGVGFQGKETTTLLNPGTLPIAIGLYGYCYSGHAVFPNIYSSMSKPSQYPSVLLTW